MDDEIGASLISTAGNIIGGLISGHQNYKNTKKLMAYQNQMNLENWRLENQYNHPAAQMARLRESGLNPSLVFDNGAQNTGGTVGSVSPAAMAGNVDFSNVGSSAVNAYYAAKMNQQQIENMKGQNDATRAMIRIYQQQAVGEALKNARESAHLGNYKVLADLAVDQAKAELESTQFGSRLRKQQLWLNDLSYTKLGVEIDNLRRQGKAITEGVAQNWARISIDKALAQSNISVNDETKRKLIADTANSVRTGNILALERTLKDFEVEVSNDKRRLHRNLETSQNPFQFAKDVVDSFVYYFRKY